MDTILLQHLKGSKAGTTESFPLATHQTLLIGRDPAAAVRYDAEKDDLVGRQHARIERDGPTAATFTITDLDSRNGTFVNRQRISGSVSLQPGDAVQLGAGGPEFAFDVDPRPASALKSTRLAVDTAPATRLAELPTAPAGVAGGIGKATVERMITDTKQKGNRNALLVGSLAVVAAAGAFAMSQRTTGTRLSEQARADSIAKDSLGRLASQAVSDANARIKPADIMAAASPAVVQIFYSWSLVFTETGGQVFHQYVPNRITGKDGKERPIVPNGRQTVPVWVAVGEDGIEPRLTLDQGSGAPITAAGTATGFVVRKDGYVLTNRHVAAGWRATYDFGDPQEMAGPVVGANGQLMLGSDGAPVIVAAPQDWVPSETKQAGPKGVIGAFQGRDQYLMVGFAGNTNYREATRSNVSDRHDVALIKVNVPSDLPTLELNDNYEGIRGGEEVAVMGYPGVSDSRVVVVRSRDSFNRDAQQRVVPEPTITVGNVGKVSRGSQNTGSDNAIYAPADRYQLTINATGGGNSGGPLFDAAGKVIAIYYAVRRSDAQVSFAVPIKFAIELMGVGSNTATR